MGHVTVTFYISPEMWEEIEGYITTSGKKPTPHMVKKVARHCYKAHGEAFRWEYYVILKDTDPITRWGDDKKYKSKRI